MRQVARAFVRVAVGIFIPSYPSRQGIFEVASRTGWSGPGGVYGDGTSADLRLGGVDVSVRHLLDAGTVTP